MPRRLNRREFLQTTTVSAAIAAGCHLGVTRVAFPKSPNEKLNVACVGATNRAGANIAEVAACGENIVAIADVDSRYLDEGLGNHKSAKGYRDFRKMLETEAANIDAVVVATPDHTHAPAAAMALRLGKHTYCEKPLTHTVLEARTLASLAKEKNLVTQMGSQIHAGDNYRRVVELLQAGVIGPVKEAHVWVNVKYDNAKFTTDKPCPSQLDWDLWLGPATERPYTEGAHRFDWRNFWDYGNGGIGDFFCHYVDLVHWGLDLRAPTRVTAKGSPVNPVSCASWVIADYDYPARGDKPAVHLTWYDGGKRPEIAAKLKDKDGKPLDWASAQLFVGEKGMILANYGDHRVLLSDPKAELKRPEPSIPSSIGHHKEWCQAIRSGGPTTCNFDYSGALTEAALLGAAAYRSGEPIEWDAANLKVTNSPKAQAFIHKDYRKGWTL